MLRAGDGSRASAHCRQDSLQALQDD